MNASRRPAEDLSAPLAAMLGRQRRETRAWMLRLGAIAAILLAAGLGVGLATVLPEWLPAVLLGIGAWLALSVMAGTLDARVVRVVPFFRERVPGPFTLTRGRALLRASGLLDRIANEHGVTPLTEFLCEDPLSGGTAVWHDAQRGVETLDALIRALTAHQPAPPEYETLLADCRAWRERLANAAEAGVPFFLMMRVGDTISGHEMSLRQGEF